MKNKKLLYILGAAGLVLVVGLSVSLNGSMFSGSAVNAPKITNNAAKIKVPKVESGMESKKSPRVESVCKNLKVENVKDNMVTFTNGKEMKETFKVVAEPSKDLKFKWTTSNNEGLFDNSTNPYTDSDSSTLYFNPNPKAGMEFKVVAIYKNGTPAANCEYKFKTYALKKEAPQNLDHQDNGENAPANNTTTDQASHDSGNTEGTTTGQGGEGYVAPPEQQPDKPEQQPEKSQAVENVTVTKSASFAGGQSHPGVIQIAAFDVKNNNSADLVVKYIGFSIKSNAKIIDVDGNLNINDYRLFVDGQMLNAAGVTVDGSLFFDLGQNPYAISAKSSVIFKVTADTTNIKDDASGRVTYYLSVKKLDYDYSYNGSLIPGNKQVFNPAVDGATLTF